MALLLLSLPFTLVMYLMTLGFVRSPLSLSPSRIANPHLPLSQLPHNRAFFQIFSDRPPLSPNKPSPPSPAAADGDAERRVNSGSRGRASPRRVYLPAFLEVCRRAGLLYPAAKAARPYHHGEGPASEMGRDKGGQANCGRGDCGRGEARGRLWEAEAEENVTAPGETFFVSVGVPLQSIFRRFFPVRRVWRDRTTTTR